MWLYFSLRDRSYDTPKTGIAMIHIIDNTYIDNTYSDNILDRFYSRNKVEIQMSKYRQTGQLIIETGTASISWPKRINPRLSIECEWNVH